MTEKGDPLLELVADTREINRARLKDLLKGRVWIDRDAATVQLVPEERSQRDAKRTILLALLGQKALALIDPERIDAMSPKVIEEVTGLKGNTVRPVLKRLADDRWVVRRADGYSVLNAALHLVAGAITRKE